MEMMGRTYLKQGDMISLSRKKGDGRGSDCEIIEKMGEGASCICYQAVFEGVEGVLKEFYPVDTAAFREEEYYFLKRTPSNQLTAVGKAMKLRFRERCEDFISGYRKLDAARKQDSRNKILNNYIPVYSILYGNGKEEEVNSVYIWNANDKTGETFETYIDAVRKNPTEYPVHKVYNILNTILTLTDCIKALHSAGLLHLDIKPANFLVPYNSMFDINPYSISLFDVDTLYSVNNRYSSLAGTPGFVAPEVKRGRGENRSDIYSLGAMLFYSLIITGDLSDGLYQEEYYGQIDQLIQSSDLLNASEVTSNVFFRACISDIMKKCLAKRTRERYQNCEELMDDLKKALAYIVPAVMNENLIDTRKRLALLEEKEESDETLTAKMQNLLYKKPLYEDVGEEEEQINVLVLGAGTYAQKFIDICFQAGQMRGKKLHITAVSGRPEEDREVYLQFRPALASFINVNGSLDGTEKEIYGELNFVPVPGKRGTFSRTNREENKEALEKILSGEKWASGVDYVFAALSDETLNQEVAKAYRSLPGRDNCPVCTYEADCDDNMEPILSKMAFYTHISWKNSLNIDMEEAWEEFKIKYNYESSLSYALSVKYKLKSVGIEVDDPNQAAKLFEEKIKDQDILDELTALEHRRWVMEKVTGGWSAPTDSMGEIAYEDCVDRALETGRTYDKVRKLHPCIVRSTKERPLAKLKKEEWDQEETIQGLDELDTVSLRLHQCFKRRGDKNLYKEYKVNDRILVERIPFILTYQSAPYMVIPFDNSGRKNAFTNVASATLLAPARITYLAYCDEESQLQRLPGKIKAVVEYYKTRGVHTSIGFLVGLKESLPYREKENLKENLSEIGLHDWKVLEEKGEKEVLQSFGRILNNRRIDLFDATPALFEEDEWNEKLKKQLGRKYPHFLFDYVDKSFFVSKGCEYLLHIREESCIRPEDLAVLKSIPSYRIENSKWEKKYEKLWALYTGEGRESFAEEKCRKIWNGLCSTLKKYEEKHKVKTNFALEEEALLCSFEDEEKKISLRTEKKAAKLMEILKNAIEDDKKLGVHLNMIEEENRRVTVITWDNLAVENLIIEEEEQRTLLEQLAKEGFLKEFSKSGKSVSFVYPSLQMKQILTVQEQLPGLYLASEAEKTGRFSLIYPGFSYQKRETGEIVRADCVLSKGLKLYFLLCNFEEAKEDNLRDLKRQFGKEIEIIEITGPKEMHSIGQILKETIK